MGQAEAPRTSAILKVCIGYFISEVLSWRSDIVGLHEKYFTYLMMYKGFRVYHDCQNITGIKQDIMIVVGTSVFNGRKKPDVRDIFQDQNPISYIADWTYLQ